MLKLLSRLGGAYNIVSGEAALSFSLAARIYPCFVIGLRASMVCLLAAVAVCLAPGPSARSVTGQAAQQAPAATAEGTPTIERIEFQGNRRIRSETLRARIFSRPGDALNEDALRRDFHALWNTQYFEDIRLEIEDSADKPNQKVIIFYVTERPIVRRIEYKGNKSWERLGSGTLAPACCLPM